MAIATGAAILGAAALGAAGSMVSADSARSSSNKARDAESAAQGQALDLEREQFEYQKRLNEPFYNMGLPGAASYASAILGKPQQYTDLSGNKLTAPVWTPQENPAYKWQQQQMEKNTLRSLRALGRSNSTYGMNALTEGNRNLAATEYDKQFGRLADLANVARGGASSLAGSSSQFANNAGNIITNSGENQANAYLANGLMKTNAINSGVGGLFSLANMYAGKK